MEWYDISKEALPKKDKLVLTYSERYKNRPELAYRIMLGQFVKTCKDVTHYMYLQSPI